MDWFVCISIFLLLLLTYLIYTQWIVPWKKHKGFITVDNGLGLLAENLTLDANFIKEAKKVAQIIFERIKQEGSRKNLKIGRTLIAGSIGKGTGIKYIKTDGKRIYPDLDLVVYINGAKPQFDKELEQLAEILEKLNDVSGLVVMRYSLKFYFETESHGKLKIDLLPAENRVIGTHQLRGQDIGEVQARYTTQELVRKQEIAIRHTGEVNRKENKLRSSSLAEITVKKIIEAVADDYVWNVVKLAKYWNSQLEMSEYVPARSCIIELITICTLQTKFQNLGADQKNLYRGFRYFLQAMRDFRILNVALNDEEYLFEGDQYSLPIILDPGNMLNNLAEGVPDEAVDIWEEHARGALKVLNREIFTEPLDIFKSRIFGNAIDDIFSHKYERTFRDFLYDVIVVVLMFLKKVVRFCLDVLRVFLSIAVWVFNFAQEKINNKLHVNTL